METGNIILIRHGPPDALPRRIVDGIGFAAWVQSYEAATLRPDTFPPPLTRTAVSTADVVFTSMLPRSRQSAEALGRVGATAMPAFNEPNLPVPAVRIIRLPVSAWLVVCRSLWLTGLHGDGETYAAARTRAAQAADVLVAAASTGTVALIGHGWINRLIGAVLAGRGWQRRVVGSALWSVTTYAMPEEDVPVRDIHSR
jgi:broad specificity phosphatase PhoE